jgi:hypothetical protein
MDDPLIQRIADEEAKLRLLEAEVESRRRRIQVLKAAAQALQTGDDDFDAVLSGKLEAKSAAVAPPGATTAPAANPFPARMAQPQPVSAPQQQANLNPQAAWPFPTAAKPDTPSLDDGRRQVHKRGEVKTALLTVLTKEPKHLSRIMLEAKRHGYELTYDRIRTQLWSYKAEGLVDNQQKGFYNLTQKGEAYVERQKGESPVAAGLSGETTDLA